ncbi:type 1 glutamine amidotransferase [Gordonia sp. NPDC003950]
MTRARVLELRHAECESPGAYLAGLDEVADVRTVRSWCEPMPDDPTDFDAILVMGGPMGANDGPTLPWIDAEIAFLTDAIAAGIPIWGVCLGSQLLARALGAAVRTGPEPELGIADVTLTADAATDPVWAGTATIPAMHWHYDTFDLPGGATLLGSSKLCAHQLFRHGPHYGVQFHLEVDTALFDEWLGVPEYRRELESALGPDGPAGIRADVARAQQITRPLAATAIRRWVEVVVAGCADLRRV